MTYTQTLRDDEWDAIKNALPGKQGDPGRSGDDNRRFVEAVVWIGKNGAKWRSLPAAFGNWSGVHKRFKRWCDKGIWQMIFNTLAASADTEWLMVDATIVRAHQCAAGAKRGQKNQALGRSCGGFTTKIHAVCDALGNPLRFILTGGERHDCTQALALLNGMHGEYLLADKGYDAAYIVEAAQKMGAQAVIPPRSNSTSPRSYDTDLYKERNHIERLFAKLKQFRRIATRYDKTGTAFMGFIHVASILLWLR